MLTLVKEGFLAQVLGPALLQVRTECNDLPLFVCVCVYVLCVRYVLVCVVCVCCVCVNVLRCVLCVCVYVYYMSCDHTLQSSVESATFATAYLTIFIKHITNPQLMRAFLSYLFMDDCDGRSVLKTLIESVGSTDTKVTCKSILCQSIEHLYLLPSCVALPWSSSSLWLTFAVRM